MQFWGDIIISHPELVSELPKDCIALEWGYEANHPFKDHAKEFAQAGVPYYVCPGTSSWNSIAGRTDNCIQNLTNAAQNGLSYGAEGYLITDWGDNGHWQTLPVSFLGFATGAALSWSYTVNHDMEIKTALDIYAFQDTSYILGGSAYDLGNIYRKIGIELENRSALFEIFQRPLHEWNNKLPAEKTIHALTHTLEAIDQLSRDIPKGTPNRQDHILIRREFNLTVGMLRHACKRGLLGFGSQMVSRKELSIDIHNIIDEYQAIWILRNRSGGLANSLSRFATPLKDYE